MPAQNDNIQGKVCMVTGATRGIGFETALGMAELGAEVILVGHNQERGEKAREKINRYAGRDATVFFRADLSSMEAIDRLAQEVKARYDRLDVLVNNAGAMFMQRKESADGYEMTFALNHLNYFRTTLLLLDLLRKSDAARIVVVSSNSHRNARLNFDDLQLENGYGPLDAYGKSKLANLLFTYELDRRLSGSGITVNALHPGFVGTNFGMQTWYMRPFMWGMHLLFGRSPEEGAETPIYLAASPEVEGVSGRYFIDKKQVESSEVSYNRQDAERLWEISKKLCGLEDFKV